MAKDETMIGITGLPIPKKKMSPAKQHEFEKARRKNIGTNVGGQTYKKDVSSGYNPRARTFEEFVGLCEKFSLAADTSKPQSPKPTTLPRSREANIGKHDDWKDKPSTEWSDRPAAGKKLKSRASAVVGTQKRQDVETGVREEYVDEAKVDAGLSDAEKAKVRTDRRFGTAGAGFVNPKGMDDLRKGLHKANRGLSQQFKRRLRGMKEENVIDEAKVEAGMTPDQKRRIRTGRSDFTDRTPAYKGGHPVADYQRRGAHRERDELNKDAKSIRKGKLNQPQFQGKTGQERIAAVKKAKGMK